MEKGMGSDENECHAISHLSLNEDDPDEVSKDRNDNADPVVQLDLFNSVKSSKELYKKKLSEAPQQESGKGPWKKFKDFASSFFKGLYWKVETAKTEKKVSWLKEEPEIVSQTNIEERSIKKSLVRVKMSPPIMKSQKKSTAGPEQEIMIPTDDLVAVAEGVTLNSFRHTTQQNENSDIRMNPLVIRVSSMTDLTELRARSETIEAVRNYERNGRSEITFNNNDKNKVRNESELITSASSDSIQEGTPSVEGEDPPFMQLNHQNGEESKGEAKKPKQVQERDDDDELIEDEPKHVHPMTEDLIVPTPEELAKILPKEFHPFIAKSCKKDCRTWLWKSSAQRKTVLDHQNEGRRST